MVKDKKFLEKISDYCLQKAKQLGATGCELVVSNSISESISIRNKKVDHSDNSDNLSIGLTIYINNKRSNVSSSNTKEQDLSKLIDRCVEMTKITPEDIHASMPDKNKLAKDELLLDLFDESTISTEKKIDFLKEMEEEAFANKKITNSNGCSFSETKSNFILSNSLGFSKGYETSMFSAGCAVVAENEGLMETDYEFSTKRFLKDLLKAKEIGNSAAKRAVRRLGAKKISSNKLPIILDKRIAKSLLSSFASAIAGSAFSRGTTFLKDKLEQDIFSKNINIFDDPLIKMGLGSQPFDSEGVTCKKIQLVENGKLKNIFLDTYHSNILKMETNGRSGGSTNLFFSNGSLKLEKMILDQKKALYITDLIGRGSDIITGDYSVGASGILIENGKFIYPVNEITIAGNLLEMYKNLTLADDLEFNYATNSPSIMINEMTIAGK
jgi:PmbA protein